MIMVDSFKHAQKTGQFKKIELTETAEVEKEVTLPFVGDIPEVVDQEHYDKMIALESEQPKKKIKVKK